MPLTIVSNDITKMKVDAIVNAAKESLLGGGGVDGAIHAAAGPELLAKCKTLGGCPTGQAKITDGFNLPAKYIIHTVGTIYLDGNHQEELLLTSCYRASLALAKAYKCKTVAFPLISSGAYGYPKDQALQVAINAISEFLLENDMTVYLVIYDKAAYQISEALFSPVAAYIDAHYAYEPIVYHVVRGCAGDCESLRPMQMDLDAKLKQLDESFSQMLLRKIDEKSITDAECYKKANIDRKLFSKIRKDVHYKPSKPTAIAFAIALELSLTETEELLRKAGFALSHSNKFDIIIEYFINNGNYNIFEINEVLFAFDQSLLGA